MSRWAALSLLAAGCAPLHHSVEPYESDPAQAAIWPFPWRWGYGWDWPYRYEREP